MTKPASTWISQGLEVLIQQLPEGNDQFHFDVIIVGSGYGGSIAASQLSGLQKDGRPLRIGVLERGREFLSGMFPSRMADLPEFTRISTPGSAHPQGNLDGLFDLRLNPHLNTVIANGLGGGSLINAGVMIEPKASIFDDRWPKSFQTKAQQELFDQFYPESLELLGAKDEKGPNTISRHAAHQNKPLAKHSRLQILASDKQNPDASAPFHDAAITMAMEDKTNTGGVKLNACNFCGDCATGCNHNAKDSLDCNLLVQAKRKGAELYTGAAVLKLAQHQLDDGRSGWALDVAHTKAKLRKRQGNPFKITAAKVILAAGSYGSTEILLRSQSLKLPLSQKLGANFSSNGDMLATVFNQNADVNAIAHENDQPNERHIGPTITGIIDMRDQPEQLLIEEMAVPGALRRVYEEMVTTTDRFARLLTEDEDQHYDGQPENDPLNVDKKKIGRTAILAIMGDDGSQGALELVINDEDDPLEGDGALKVQWAGLPDNPLFPHQVDTLTEMIKKSKSGGLAQGNPAWSPLPPEMEGFLGDGGKGPQLTVHPLGGCGMGDDHHHGVVDEYGRVFDPSERSIDNAVHDNLVVLDGAMIPTALGANPALTISAVSLRAIRHLRQHWQFETSDDSETQASEQRPVFADKSKVAAVKPTKVEITERIGGRVILSDQDQNPVDCYIDITLRFRPKPILDFVHDTKRTMEVNTERQLDEPYSCLRVFRLEDWQHLTHQGANDETFDEAAILLAPVRGTMEIMGREGSSPKQRRKRALKTWALNRGIRDIYQSFEEKVSNFQIISIRKIFQPNPDKVSQPKKDPFKKVREVLALASRAGEVRLFDYKLTMDRPDSGWPTALGGFDSTVDSLPVNGKKHISYTRSCNPMRQFEDMHLNDFPGLRPDIDQACGKSAYLRFDSRFITHYNKPLIRVVEQQDQVTAMADLGAFFAYFLRVLLNIHLWSFRKPDAQLPGEPSRLPGKIPHLPKPQITELCVDSRDVGLAVELPVNVRLTRYANAKSNQPPVVMIHGYSASGNTFTHPSINPSMARYFWKAGRDVWVLDMRTSSGMPTAMLPWSFEDVAFADIPVAIDHICRTTEKEKVDIIAHCMGSAMFSMAVLAPPENNAPYHQERTLLPQRINKAVLSQVGPRVVFAPENIFRAYTLSYVRQLMPFVFYQFKRSDAPNAVETLLDRLLSALPYPDGEFEMENPIWPWAKTPYVGTRHRMDALYGRTFSLDNLSKRTLDKIDDIFGPLNMETLSQVIRFALHERVTNKHGENEFVTNERLKEYWNFPTLSVHGDENGLSDIATLGRMEETMQEAGRDYRTLVFEGFGHQDSLIGKGVQKNFNQINEFLNQPIAEKRLTQTEHHFRLEPPFSGPTIGAIQDVEGVRKLPVSLGFDTQMNKPEFVLFVAVKQNENGWQLAATQSASDDINQEHMLDSICVKFAQPKKDNWLKTDFPVTETFAKADGVLVLVLDDKDQRLDQLHFGPVIPDNLWDYIRLPEKAQVKSSSHDTLKDYLQTYLLGEHFRNCLKQTLQRPDDELRPAIIALPTDSTQTATQFVLAACQYPANMVDRRLAYASYSRLAQHLDNGDRTTAATLTPQFAVLMGDQVYTDPSAGMMDPTERFDRFVDAYHNWLKQRPVKSVLRRLPAFMMLDDHELLNDWDQAEAHVGDASHERNGKSTYWTFQRNLHQTPETISPINEPFKNSFRERLKEPLWYSFEHQGFDFFMMDSRSERQGRSVKNEDRSKNVAPLHEANLISDEQLQALKDWLLAGASDGRPRFVVSPSMLLPRRLRTTQSDFGGLHSDAWDGYPKTLNEVLGFIAEHNIQNLVFLSGDEHLSSFVDITLTHAAKGTHTRVISIHSSGLYAPMSFVNSTPELFAQDEHFSCNDQVNCEVSSRFYPGDGYALISAYQGQGNGGGWTLECSFEREETAVEGRDSRTEIRPSLSLSETETEA